MKCISAKDPIINYWITGQRLMFNECNVNVRCYRGAKNRKGT
jgi:hypothetical protein